jgi:hypothetical protein
MFVMAEYRILDQIADHDNEIAIKCTELDIGPLLDVSHIFGYTKLVQDDQVVHGRFLCYFKSDLLQTVLKVKNDE